MAQNKVTIDVEARFIDNLTGKVNKADKAVEDLRKKKAKVSIDADDNASKKLLKIEEKTKGLSDKLCKISVALQDNEALSALNKIGSKAESLTKKAWTTTVKLKDLATAPLRALKNQLFSIKSLALGIATGAIANKAVISTTKMYANYEDLVAQFKVLLGSQEAAQARIEELTSFAGQTPFTRDEIYQASRVLQTYTEGALATPDATGGLRMIGDIAAATGHEYTQVATYMGRLYNEVKRGGETLGEPLAMLREMGALSAESEEAIKEIATGSGTIEQKWEQIAGQFSKTDGMMLEMSNQMNNLMLGVTSFLKNNLWMKLGAGISDSLKPFLIDFRTWRNSNKELIAGWAADIQKFAANASEKVLGVVRSTASRMFEITQSTEFQNADMFGKIGLLWEKGIKNPFKGWWERTVVPWWDQTVLPWLSDKANRMGDAIGTGLSNGLLMLLGATPEAGEAGVSVAGSFVRGFLDGFDGTAVTNALLDAIVNVWDALPLWAKALVGSIGVGKAAGGIMSIGAGIGNIGKVLGSASEFTGLLGMGSKVGMALTPTAALPGSFGALSALGLAGLAGAGVGIASGVSGAVDMYKGFTDTNLTDGMAQANKQSGFMKLSGAGIGAAIGTILLPGIGTAIGAGLGGLAGWLGGNHMKKSAAEKIGTMDELEKAAKSSKEAAAELERRQKLIADGMAEAFGNVKLTFEEVNDLINELVLGQKAEDMKNFASATQSANRAMSSLESSAEALNKWNWKASIGMKFSEDDAESYKSAVATYISDAESVVEAEHYKFTAAVDMLIKPLAPEKGRFEEKQSIIQGMDAYYAELQKTLDETTTELTEQVNIALEDGVIDADEEKIIAELQAKISDITTKVAKAQSEAKMETLKIKFGSGELDEESVQLLQQELASTLEESASTYDDALTVGITGLNLELADGAISQEEYDAQFQALVNGYNENMEALKMDAANIQLEIAGEAFDIDTETLNNAMQASIKEGIEPINWTQEDADRFIGGNTLTESGVAALGSVLSSVAETVEPLDVAAIDTTGTDEMAANAKTKIDSSLNSKLAEGYSGSMDVRINVNPIISGMPTSASLGLNAGGNYRGGIVYPSGITTKGFAGGGMVRGGAQLAWLAEEGTPEMVIPLGSQRRKRGLNLWEKAGHMLGVPGFANGGIVGGDEGIRNMQYGGGASGGDQNVQVDVGGVTVEVNVDGNGNMDIAEQIRSQGAEIADTISGILADAFNAQFANTPVRGEA